MQVTLVASPRNQPFRTARLPKGAGHFFVCFFLLSEDKQGGEITDQFYLQFAVDGMKTDLIDKAPEDFSGLFPGPVFVEGFAEAVDLGDVKIGNIGMEPHRFGSRTS